MRLYELEKFKKTDLPLAVWVECPTILYQLPHWHDCNEMVLICEGTGWCAVNDRKFPMLRGDLYIMGASDVHEFSGNPGLTFFNIMFSEDFFSEDEKSFFGSLLKKHEKYTFPPALGNRLIALLTAVVSEIKNRRPGAEIIIRSLFIQFLVEVTRNLGNADAIASGKEFKRVSRMFDLIARRFREKLSLADLSAEVGGTPEYVGKQFKQLTGINFTDYLCRYRIEQAQSLLENSDTPISEIAAELGFFDSAYFDKQFRKILGITPLAYRKLSRVN